MQNLLASNEYQILEEHFRFTNSVSADRHFSISVSELLDKEKMIAYLNQLAAFFPAVNRKVIASQFSKRYSFMILMPNLYSMSIFNKQLNMSTDNCHIESADRDGIWLPRIRLQDTQVAYLEPENRQLSLNHIINQLFAEHLAKVWDVLSKVSNLPKVTIWENAAIYVYWLYETRMQTEIDKKYKKQIDHDFQYLLYDAPGELFGAAKNPIKRYYNSKCRSPLKDQLTRYRTTCCLYYLTKSQGEYCSTCPKFN